MKSTFIKRIAVPVVLGTLLSLSSAKQAWSQCCLPLEGPPLGAYVLLNWSGYYVPPGSFFDTQVFAGAPIPAGDYLTWCVDTTHGITSYVPGSFSGQLYATCDPTAISAINGILAARGNPTVSAATWNAVNYLLNHKPAGVSPQNIQAAIWYLVCGCTTATADPQPDPNIYVPLAAAARAASASWTPQCGNVVGVVFSIPDISGNIIQLLMLEVPCNCQTPPPPPQHNCTYTIGYYKNHPSAIAPLPVYLGNVSGVPPAGKTLVVDSQQKGVDVLSQKVYCSPSDGITKLYAQLLAAKLNIANGADPSAIASVIAAADAFLATHDCTDWSKLSATDACLVLVWQCALDSYNNGNIGPGHCGDSTSCSSGGSSGGDDGSDDGSDDGGNGSHDNSGGSQGNDNSGGKGCKTGGH